MKVLAYFRPDPKDRNWFNLLVHYAVNNAYGGYYKIIAVENIGGLSDILLGGNSVKCVQTKDELVAMTARLEARAKRNSTTIEDGKGNSVYQDRSAMNHMIDAYVDQQMDEWYDSIEPDDPTDNINLEQS
tara:strand:+ start:41 stop:430 length:390 start_codon:yes stop_codon:yes gene_type:complete